METLLVAGILLDLAWFILAFFAFYYVLKSWIKSRYNINLLMVFLVLFLIVYSFNTTSSLFIYLLGGNRFSITPYIYNKIGENLTIGYIMANLLILSSLQFLLYLRNYKVLYTLPIVCGLILFMALYLTVNDIINILFALIVIAAILIDGIRNKNGIEIGVAFINMFVLSCFTVDMLVPNVILGILRVVASFMVFLGFSGILDKTIFPDKEMEDKIKNTWITRMVVKKI